MALFIGHEIMEMQAVESTNLYLNVLMSERKVREGFILSAKEQTAGRGQRGTRWESESGQNLTLSIALYPTFLRLEEQFLLNKVIALAVADFIKCSLKQTSSSSIEKQEVKIKWPNDIYVNDKKIAGILIENTVRNNRIASSIVGIGINVNQTEFSNTINNAISLKSIMNISYDLKRCMEILCSFVEARYLQLKALNETKIGCDYENFLFRFNQWSNFEDNAGILFNAKITGTSRAGKLILEKRNGETKEYGLKELVFII